MHPCGLAKLRHAFLQHPTIPNLLTPFGLADFAPDAFLLRYMLGGQDIPR